MLLFVLMQLFICYNNIDAKLERFVIEENLLLPIFGSFAYDPMTQDFVLPEREYNGTQSQKLVNGTFLSTVINEDGTSRNPNMWFQPEKIMFRQNMNNNSQTPSVKSLFKSALTKKIVLETSKRSKLSEPLNFKMSRKKNSNLVQSTRKSSALSDTSSEEMQLSKQAHKSRLYKLS